jgi:hypothetical protein
MSKLTPYKCNNIVPLKFRPYLQSEPYHEFLTAKGAKGAKSEVPKQGQAESEFQSR